MNWVKGFQATLDYMEEHLTEPVDFEQIAKQMNLSAFYFQKIFSILCGISPGEYIRNRRLTLAGSELLTSNRKILDIALDYGYDTQEGFTRAFTRFHGVTPGCARKNPVLLKSFSRLSVSITMKGGFNMNCRVEEKDRFQIIAKTERFTKIENVLGREDIPRFWLESHADGTVSYLKEHGRKNGILSGSVVGMCCEDSTVRKDFPYSIGAEYDGGDVPEGYQLFDIPAATWLIFEMEAGLPAESIQDVWHKIFAEYFPTSDYQPSGNFDFEVYFEDASKSNQIWIAVMKK